MVRVFNYPTIVAGAIIVNFCLISFCQAPQVKQVDVGTVTQPEELPSSQFYKVISRNGLNLRESPDINAKRISTLPFLQTGRILAERRAIMDIQQQHGRWLKIAYKGLEGYIFSGFVLLGDSEAHVNDMFERMQFKFQPWKTRSLDLSKEKIVTQIPWANGWKLIEVEKNASENCDYKKTFKNLVVINEEKRIQTTQVLLEQYIEDTRLMDRKILISDGNYCHCCCKFHDTELHLVRPEAIYSIPFYYGKQKASCGHSFIPESEARVNPSRFFYYIKEPICLESVSENSFSVRQGKVLFADEKFLVIEKNGDYKMYNSIPKELKAEWDNSVLFVK